MNKCAYVLGGYQTDFSRNWSKENKHIISLMREAYEGSVVVTSIEPSDIEAAFIGNFAAELYCNQGQLGAFFLEFDNHFIGIPTARFEAACASSSIAIMSAIAYVNSGIHDLIAVLGVEQMKTVDAKIGGEYLGTAAWYEREAKGVEFPFPKLFSKLGEEYEKRYGLDQKHLAAIAAKNYHNAKKNLNAQTRNWYMDFGHACNESEYNPVIGGMIKVSDCSQVTDGAVCIYIASERYANEYCSRRGISFSNLPRISGWGHTTAPMAFQTKIQIKEEYVLPLTRKAITDAYKRAGIKDCWDLDAIETHDCFTTTEYMAIDHFGLTRPGESWKALEEGIVSMGGKLPVNPSGGLIGVGHPVGATGARQLLDAYKQVSGQAGEQQVEGARRVATLNIGGTATTNVCFIVAR